MPIYRTVDLRGDVIYHNLHTPFCQASIYEFSKKPLPWSGAYCRQKRPLDTPAHTAASAFPYPGFLAADGRCPHTHPGGRTRPLRLPGTSLRMAASEVSQTMQLPGREHSSA